MIKIDLENTFKRALSDGINLFLGSGFSVLAEDSEGNFIPTGNDLATELIEKFKLHHLSTLPLNKLCTILQSEKKDQLYEFLKKRFSVCKFNQKYSELNSVNIKTIYTTNIDDLVYKIYASSNEYYLNDVTRRGPKYGDRTAINFVPLHGTILDNNNSLVFSTFDIATAFSSDRDKWHCLTEGIQKHPTLFWGYSVDDAGVLEALSPRSVSGREHQAKWIILSKQDNANLQYFKALGFHIIISNTLEMLEFISSLSINKEKITSSSCEISTHKLFPDLAIPSIGKVSVRPLIDFYLGAAPIWSDVFSGRLHKTSHFYEIENSINSGKNTIVIGIPACGKTTLMMQLSADIYFGGHKLVCEAITEEKACLIVQKLGKERAIIFIDNFADEIETFEFLIKSQNVQVVGFDRDYNFDIASHKVSRDLCNIIDVTDLNNRDIQEILSRIPPEIGNRNVTIKTEKGITPSLFELIESHITTPSLKKRFISVLDQLKSESEDLHDLLVMCCYVHMCRTPVSFDMVYAFLRDKIKEYNDVYQMLSKLGALIHEHTGENQMIDTDQDHFSPRSTIVSEAILDQVSPVDLKRILYRFYNEISPLRICRFDIFKRKAYDANLIRKAFLDWQEGKRFYEMLYERNNSPYLRQQGALYLASKYRFRDAFAWIDDALVMSKGKIFSIRNSHAIILFKANINGSDDDPLIRQTLNDSMNILSECYFHDKRKTYHTITFSDQAIQYFEKYRDSTAKNYLETAKKWILEEQRLSPWSRKLRNSLREVTDRLL